MKVYIIKRNESVITELDSSNPRLDLKYPHAPKGMAKYVKRVNSPNWDYVYYGYTKEECLFRCNEYIVNQINKLKAEIELYTSRIIRLEDTTTKKS